MVAVPLFIAALVVTLAAAATFARRLDRLGAKYGLPEVWIGLLTALAADGPEVSSALVALIKGAPRRERRRDRRVQHVQSRGDDRS